METHFTADDGKQICLRTWLPGKSQELKAIVQISHGMAEHSARYGEFAAALNRAGFGVFANDHRGHGKTAGTPEQLGHFGDSGGWDLALGDLYQITQSIKSEHPGQPLFLFGHSMGSFLARDFASRHGHELAGVILSGTVGDPGLLGNAGILVAKIESLLRGKRARSRLLDKLTFGGYNKAFRPNRTKFDWLSRDEDVVDQYIEDPLCGTISTAGFFGDLLGGIKRINSASNIDAIPKELPVFFFAGALDPVGDNTKGVLHAVRAFQKSGIRDVTFKFYQGARHEMLGETNRAEVFADIIEWLRGRL